MLSLIVAAVIVLTSIADVDAPFKQLELDQALPPLPDNVAAYEPIPREPGPKVSSRPWCIPCSAPRSVQATFSIA